MCVRLQSPPAGGHSQSSRCRCCLVFWERAFADRCSKTVFGPALRDAQTGAYTGRAPLCRRGRDEAAAAAVAVAPDKGAVPAQPLNALSWTWPDSQPWGRWVSHYLTLSCLVSYYYVQKPPAIHLILFYTITQLYIYIYIYIVVLLIIISSTCICFTHDHIHTNLSFTLVSVIPLYRIFMYISILCLMYMCYSFIGNLKYECI